jgi:hypothetical protein
MNFALDSQKYVYILRIYKNNYKNKDYPIKELYMK